MNLQPPFVAVISSCTRGVNSRGTATVTVSAPRSPQLRGDDGLFSHIRQENTVYPQRWWREEVGGGVNRGE